jgi:hypothetical protein
MDLNKINEQVKNAPLTKKQLKKQFVETTNKLGLKHSFNFDEAWDIGQELRKKKDFRDKITKLQNQLENLDGAMTGEELTKLNPLKHSFADGCYVREIFNPAGQILVTKIHKKKHPFFLLKGKMSILTENGIEHLKAPYHGITSPGTKRVIYTHEDCVFVTVHATENTTIKDVEEEVIANDFDDPAIALEDIKLLKNNKGNFKELNKNIL